MKMTRFLRGLAASAAALTAAWSVTACGPTIIQLNETDNGRTIECAKGDTIEIRLPGNPTTGYLWQQAAAPTNRVIVLTHENFEQYNSDNRMVGVPGTFLFTYEVSGTGKEGIRLIHHRPWEKDTPVGNFQLLVDAK